MKRGKDICKTLKRIRKEVADANEIIYEPTECHYEGDCEGTCPRCEQEVRYIEKQLERRRSLGKAVTIAGIGISVAALSSCFFQMGKALPPPEAGRVPYPNPNVDTLYQENSEKSGVNNEEQGLENWGVE